MTLKNVILHSFDTLKISNGTIMPTGDTCKKLEPLDTDSCEKCPAYGSKHDICKLDCTTHPRVLTVLKQVKQSNPELFI